MDFSSRRILLSLGLAALLGASISCGGGGSSSTSTTASTTGSVQTVISDDTTEDWATIGVKVLSISLVPQSDGSPVTIFTAPSPAPMINLIQLDQLGEIIGNSTVPPGTYSSANVTISTANNGTSCDVLLVASADPEPGFDQTAGSTVPCSNLQIVGGSSGSLVIPINFASAVTVNAGAASPLDIEFNLHHPAFIVEHYPVGASAPTWAVNFKAGAVRHHPHADITALLLRHMYGQVASVSSDNTSITINRAFPVLPVTTPETATVSTISVPIQADATNGTLFYNLDSSTTPTTIYNFSSLASSLPNEYVRIAARYQAGGTLVATRIFASSSFGTIWKDPEGHVLHVNTTTQKMRITTEDGGSTAFLIGPSTNFYYGSSNTVIGTGTTFFDGVTAGGLPNLARGFKVNATVDAGTNTAVAVEIEVARYNGSITNPTSTGFNYTRTFANVDGLNAMDDYAGTLDYISSTSANYDQKGNAITGFYWWDFTYPTQADTGSTAVADFESAAGGSVNLGWETLPVYGTSRATWNDPAAANSWAAKWTVLTPTEAPLGTVTTPFTSNSNGGTFTFTVPVPSTVTSGATATPATVDVSNVSGSATLVYQVDRQSGVITVTQQDITNSSTLSTVSTALAAGVPVKVYGVPQTDGSLKAYVLIYFTHTVTTK